jgi:putative FmdB family regulatory protein
MPLYEYRCAKCGNVFETIQKFVDEPLKTHPECGGEVERLISRSALQFKGSGWYITDYAKSGAPKEGKPANGEKGEAKPKTDAPAASKTGDSSSSPSSPSSSTTTPSSSTPSSSSSGSSSDKA